MTKKFRCLVCGYIHEGETAPQECPLCHVGPEDFEELAEVQGELTWADEYNWLLTGEGEMLKQSPSDDLSAAKSEINADSAKNWDEVRKKAEEQLNMLGMGSPMNDREQKLAYLLSESTNEASYWKNKCKLAEMNLT